jgi:Flp pilus assembly pilin Flp
VNDKKLSRLAFLVDDRGAATAEYAIATMAAVGFAGLLVVIMRSDEVRTILFDLVKSALTFTNPNAAPTQ